MNFRTQTQIIRSRTLFFYNSYFIFPLLWLGGGIDLILCQFWFCNSLPPHDYVQIPEPWGMAKMVGRGHWEWESCFWSLFVYLSSNWDTLLLAGTQSLSQGGCSCVWPPSPSSWVSFSVGLSRVLKEIDCSRTTAGATGDSGRTFEVLSSGNPI